MNKIFMLLGLLIAGLLMSLIGWVVLYTPDQKAQKNTVLQTQIDYALAELETQNDIKPPSLEVGLLSNLDQVVVYTNVDVPEIIASCIINQTKAFKTDLKPCAKIDRLKFKNMGHIKNLIITRPFELIQSGVPVNNIDENGEQTSSPSFIQLKKIGVSGLGDIYILPGYQYAFPESEYSYEIQMKYNGQWTEYGENIEIYMDDPVKKYKSFTGVVEQTDPLKVDLPACPEINQDFLITSKNEYYIRRGICQKQQGEFRQDHSIVDFNDIDLHKCIKKNLKLKSNEEIK
ncbi:MAG: hypothetical protein HRU38_05860 [Saccharospirillaceae bacterium]|nr:hypothetical protein [Pseudomonadales bacterium]NRB78182.1 hypothetical protein [Saccharospirillaceae bacterium]